MEVQKLYSEENKIYICLSDITPRFETFYVRVYLPTFPVTQFTNFPEVYQAEPGILIIRNNQEQDLRVCKFEVYYRGTLLSGPKYLEEIKDAQENFEYPKADSKKGLYISDIDNAKYIGVKYTSINAFQQDFFQLTKKDSLEWKIDGQTYYFNKQTVEELDKQIKEATDAGIIVTLTVVNLFRKKSKLWDKIKHPDTFIGQKGQNLLTEFNNTNDSSLASQFNITNPEGLGYFRAFISFLANRYCRENGEHGRAVGFIVGNEVDSAGVWCSCGEKTTKEFTSEYADIVRLAWQTAASYYSNVRVYVSFDHFWTWSVNGNIPCKIFYSPKKILYYLNLKFQIEGEVPWNVAFHPYPFNLYSPNYWDDILAVSSQDSPIISFKNLEILAEFLKRPEYLYKGKPRHINLSEQGFNSSFTDTSEFLQAMAFARAYRKVMEIPEIDCFVYHTQWDNIEEFGLNLGLWRRTEDGKSMEGPKPIYYVFKAIDQPDETGRPFWERC